jgi:hypothetical protein
MFEEAVLNMVADTPSTSTRRVGHAMHASCTAVWKVVYQQQLHPYNQQKVQAMGPADSPRRQEFSQWFLQLCAAEPRFPSIVLYTDGASFTRESIINSIRTMFGQMKIRTQHSNKATSKDFPSMSGVVLFIIF